VSFFWLNYRYPDGQFAGAVVIEATALLSARMLAAVFGLDEGLDFAGGIKIDSASADRIPDIMIDRLLNHRDLRRLHRLCLTKQPPAPSVKARPKRKLQRQSDGEPGRTSHHRMTTRRRVGKR